jgi:uncharacterized protein YheU (UPF0270 family)
MIVEVPASKIDPDTLRRLLEELVTRDGTDYGAREATLEQKVQQVRGMLDRGEAAILFDDESGAIHVAPTDKRR